MTWWTVTVPTVRTDGDTEIHGSQTWVVRAPLRSVAEQRALAHAATEDAHRHRRGAAIVHGSITITRWQGLNTSFELGRC